MQTFITDFDYNKSAKNLDRQRLGSQIYEGIHILSSLIGVNDQLVNPKRSVINHPVAKFWAGYEFDLLAYIASHMLEWYDRGYKSDINSRNYEMIYSVIYDDTSILKTESNPKITPDLIKLHKAVLIQKKPEYYNKIFK